MKYFRKKHGIFMDYFLNLEFHSSLVRIVFLMVGMGLHDAEFQYLDGTIGTYISNNSLQQWDIQLGTLGVVV